MKGLFGAIVVVVVAAAIYFGGPAMGLWGGKTMLSDDDIAATLAAYAEEINGADGLKFDDFSQLASAVHVEKQITIRGNSILDSDALPRGYLDTRKLQVALKICMDEGLRAAIDSGATFVYNWFSADDGDVGTVTARGETWCADNGH